MAVGRRSAGFLLVFVLVGMAGAVPPARAFDCSLARTVTEKAVCASPELTAADRDLNDAYRAALVGRSPAERNDIQAAQRAWLKGNDAACHGDVPCLGRRYRDRIAALGAVRPSGSIRYRTVTVTKKSPYALTLSYPEFEGVPADRVAALNAWVKDNLPDCSAGDASADSEVTAAFTVKKLNGKVVAIHVSEDLGCSFQAHPSEESTDVFLSVTTGKAVDLYTELPGAARKSVTAHFIAQGKSLSDADCAGVFDDGGQDDTDMAALFDKGRITFSPDFPFAIQACDDSYSASFSPAELKALYPASSPAIPIVDGLME